jgi:hypothetical protein
MPSFINRPGVIKALKVYSALAKPSTKVAQAQRAAKIVGVVSAAAKVAGKAKAQGKPVGAALGNFARVAAASDPRTAPFASLADKLVSKGVDAFNDRRSRGTSSGVVQKVSRVANFLADQAGHKAEPGAFPQTYPQWKKEGPIETPRKPYSASSKPYDTTD